MTDTTKRAFKSAAYEHLAGVGKALSSATRLEILDLLLQRPRTVESLASEVEQTVANTSHHLQALKRAKLVTSDRDGLHMVYTIASPQVGSLVARLQAVAEAHVAELRELTRDFFSDRDSLEPIDAETLRDRMQRDEVVLIDVRPNEEFEVDHVAGAISIPLETLSDRLEQLPDDRMVVAYCRGPFCTFSADAVETLRRSGYDARRFEGSVHRLRDVVERRP